MPVNIPDICLIQFLLVISSPEHMEAGIVCIIKYPVIVKRCKHSLIDGITQRYLIGHIVIADLIYIPAIHPLRRCGQAEKEMRFEILYDSFILVIDCMMKLVSVLSIGTINFFIFFLLPLSLYYFLMFPYAQ